MDVKLDKQSKIPVYLQIVDQLRAQIMCGALPSGSVLPSERGLAQMLEVLSLIHISEPTRRS